MLQSSYLAFKYISFHRVRSLVLVFSIGIIIYLPIGLKKLIRESEARLHERALATPLIIGAKGSTTDQVINTLYFRQEKTESIRMKIVDELRSLDYGVVIPLACMFSARNVPIVGTDQEYFSFRGLTLAEGRPVSYLGECVLGSTVADNLGLGVGDSIVSSPENIVDIAGVYPLKMPIVGVFNQTDSPDDLVVFTDIKTNWVIMGLGHGHQDLSKIQDNSVILERNEKEVKAGAKLFMYNSISAENIDSFHFHGNTEDYPISSCIVVPKNHKSATILLGKFASGMFDEQIMIPEKVIQTLLQSVFKIQQIFNTIFVLVGAATLLILMLIVTLSLRLRRNEIHTMFTLGSSSFKVAEIIALELLMLLIGSFIFATVLYAGTDIFVNRFINQIIF